MICKICGKEFDKLQYSGEYSDVCSSECFHRKFWNDIADTIDDPKRVIVSHNAYYIGDESSKSLFRGYGGRKFHIKFFDGREVVTTNLWHNGEIPEEYYSRIPDNAIFIRD